MFAQYTTKLIILAHMLQLFIEWKFEQKSLELQ